jgi:hypothetical protein
MRWKQQMGVSSLMALLVILLGYIDVSAEQKSLGKNPGGKSCPHQKEVKKVPGSKIAFMEDSVDFGQIPYDRKVTHTFHFKNEGTSPLLLSRHASSKVIEGC